MEATPRSRGQRVLLFALVLGTLAIWATCAGMIWSLTPVGNYVRMVLLQRKVDRELPDGTPYVKVKAWCAANGFREPYKQIESPSAYIRMIGWKPMTAEQGTGYFGIDFYLEAKTHQVYRRSAFRGSGRNDDGTGP